MRETISIAFACDEAYARHVAVVIKSILANAEETDSFEFHIITMELTALSQSRLQQIAKDNGSTLEIHYIEPSRLSEFPESRLTLNAYLRLFIPELFSEKNKILYLDADLIVLDSLRSLWEHPLDNCAVAAAVDSMECFGGSSLEHFRNLGLPPAHAYFNSGVLLLNLKNLRDIQLLEKVIAWFPNNIYPYADQDALNATLVGQISYFHVRWNLQVPLIDPVRFGWGCLQEQAEAVANPAIIHYVTERKAWCREYKLPFQKLYFQYLSQTPWKTESFPAYTLAEGLNRFKEEMDWCYKWARSEIRRKLGRHPQPTR